MTQEQALKVMAEVCGSYVNIAKADGLTMLQVTKQVEIIQQALQVVTQALEQKKEEKKLDKKAK